MQTQNRRLLAMIVGGAAVGLSGAVYAQDRSGSGQQDSKQRGSQTGDDWKSNRPAHQSKESKEQCKGMVSAMESQRIGLTEAIDKAEAHTQGKAIAGRALFGEAAPHRSGKTGAGTGDHVGDEGAGMGGQDRNPHGDKDMEGRRSPKRESVDFEVLCVSNDGRMESVIVDGQSGEVREAPYDQGKAFGQRPSDSSAFVYEEEGRMRNSGRIASDDGYGRTRTGEHGRAFDYQEENRSQGQSGDEMPGSRLSSERNDALARSNQQDSSSRTGEQTGREYRTNDQNTAPLRLARAGELQGLKVVGQDGEDMGKIETVALNVQSGKVPYVIVSIGGFLDIGDEHFAIPWNAIEVKDGKDPHAVLPVQKGYFDDAEGIDDGELPAQADMRFAQKSKGVETMERAAPGSLMKLDDVLGKAARTDSGKKLGEVQEIVVDTSSGDLVFVVLEDATKDDRGPVAVPWTLAQIDKKDKEIDLSITSGQIAQAPTVDWDNWNLLRTDGKWVNRLYTTFGQPAYDSDQARLRRMTAR